MTTKELSLEEKILKLKKERNAIILAHNYQLGEVQEPFVYSPAVRRDQVLGSRATHFLQTVFDGQAEDLVLHLAEQAELSPEDLQRIEAKILETHTVGSRYAFGTKMGWRYPLEKWFDVDPGQIIELILWEDKKSFPGSNL